MVTYIHGVALFFLFPPFCPFVIPFPFPLYSPLLTWRPPAVTELSSLLSGFLQTDPICPSLHPINPPIPNPRNPNSSAPDNDDIGATPLPLCGTLPPQCWRWWCKFVTSDVALRGCVSATGLRVVGLTLGPLSLPLLADGLLPVFPCHLAAGLAHHSRLLVMLLLQAFLPLARGAGSFWAG